jgi:peroxiredoxin family protein
MAQTTEDVLVRQEEEDEKKLVIFFKSGDLESLWAALILATTGAAMAMQVTVFATFWGLFPFVRNDRRVFGENWIQKMLSLINRGGTEHVRLSKHQFLGAGPKMMRALAKRHKVASPSELMEMATDMGVSLVPCQMTMDMLGMKREDLIEGLGEPAGATSALLEADGATTLFV